MTAYNDIVMCVYEFEPLTVFAVCPLAIAVYTTRTQQREDFLTTGARRPENKLMHGFCDGKISRSDFVTHKVFPETNFVSG